MVLAAGAGRRLRPDTDALPKALLPVARAGPPRAGQHGEITILDIALRNLAAVGLRDVVVVVGYAADAVRDRAAPRPPRSRRRPRRRAGRPRPGSAARCRGW